MPPVVPPIPCYFHSDQLDFKPRYEWAFGEKLAHPETTARAEGILASLEAEPDLFEIRAPKSIPLSSIRRLHAYNLLTLYNTARQLPPGHTFYPTVFLRGKMINPDATNIQHAGHFCFDSGTPLNRLTYNAATWSAACAEDAAKHLLKGPGSLTFALSRPPGHHATKDRFGGYCYFNNSALAARQLRRKGTVAIVDIDFHHGNGAQSIFWRDPKVLTISIHGDPAEFYPFFLGFGNENGAGLGEGFNLNVPLPAKTNGAQYEKALKQHVLPALKNFDPAHIVLATGVDGYERDPVGDFALTTKDFHRIGELLGRLHIPTVAVMEGGYYTPHIGRNVTAVLKGVRDGHAKRRY